VIRGTPAVNLEDSGMPSGHTILMIFGIFSAPDPEKASGAGTTKKVRS
jgi:hypothetical protein